MVDYFISCIKAGIKILLIVSTEEKRAAIIKKYGLTKEQAGYIKSDLTDININGIKHTGVWMDEQKGD